MDTMRIDVLNTTNHSMRALLALLVWSAISVPSLRADTVDDVLKEARTALAEGQAKNAIRLADKAIALDPKNPQAYLLRGIAHGSLRQHAGAITDFDKVLSLNPQSTEVFDRRGTE